MQKRDDDFPPYPTIGELPAGMTDDERHAFASRLIAEQGDALGDYLFAATRTVVDHGERMRWLRMIDLVQDIVGEPITLSYRACDRIAAERGDDALMPGDYAPPTVH